VRELTIGFCFSNRRTSTSIFLQVLDRNSPDRRSSEEIFPEFPVFDKVAAVAETA
jgi:hypothetical protein